MKLEDSPIEEMNSTAFFNSLERCYTLLLVWASDDDEAEPNTPVEGRKGSPVSHPGGASVQGWPQSIGLPDDLVHGRFRPTADDLEEDYHLKETV